MKKVIEGHLYNTETARELGFTSNGVEFVNDFRYASETLYATRSGLYFLHCYGGPMTRYARRRGDEWGFGETIVPLSEEAAREWGEAHLDADGYGKAFGPVVEGSVNRSVSLPSATSEKLTALAQDAGLSVSAMVAKLVEQA